jgi:hypothetical protein
VSDVLTHGQVASSLLALAPGEPAERFGVPVLRLDRHSWRVGPDGAPALPLLAAMDTLMALAGYRARALP